MATHQWAWRASSWRWAERCRCRWLQTLSSRRVRPRSSSWPHTWWTHRRRSWAWSTYWSQPSSSPSGTLQEAKSTRGEVVRSGSAFLKIQKHWNVINRVDCKLLFSPGRGDIRCETWGAARVWGTFNGNSAVKRRRVPCYHGTVLANWCAFHVLRRVGHICRCRWEREITEHGCQKMGF